MADHRFLPAFLNRGVAWLLALGMLLALPACDSDDDDGNLSRVNGLYEAVRVVFETDGNLVEDVDVLRRASDVEMRFFPDDAEVNISYVFRNDNDETNTRQINGRYNVRGGEVEIDLDDAQEVRRRQLLLPDRFDLGITSDGDVLAGTIERTDEVPLADYSRSDYGSQRSTGVLNVRLAREE